MAQRRGLDHRQTLEPGLVDRVGKGVKAEGLNHWDTL